MIPPWRILWVDDQIDLLQPHILLLRRSGYEVTGVHSGEDALHLAAAGAWDLVLLDERMPGLDGLTVLERLGVMRPELPVVMVTQQEDEELMEQAHGRRAADFLTKPVNPSQVVAVCKRLLEGPRLRRGAAARGYTQAFARISGQLERAGLDAGAWALLGAELARWQLAVEASGQPDLADSIAGLQHQADALLARRIPGDYPGWVADRRPWTERLDQRLQQIGPGAPDPSPADPLLVTDVLAAGVLPLLAVRRHVLLVVMDCLRFDQWLAIEPLLAQQAHVETRPVLSLLPTATPFGRNALLSARFPDEVAAAGPDLWQQGWQHDARGLNRYEPERLSEVLDQAASFTGGARLAGFERVWSPSQSEAVARRLGGDLRAGLTVVVVGFLDLLAHGQAESEILQELAPDAAAFRALGRQWFERSALHGLITGTLARAGGVVLASDHGSVQVRRPVEVRADSSASGGLRWKAGRNLVAGDRRGVRIEQPEPWRLPRLGLTNTWMLAAEDSFLIFSHQGAPVRQRYAGSFQHGGLSLEELVVPLVRILPR